MTFGQIVAGMLHNVVRVDSKPYGVCLQTRWGCVAVYENERRWLSESGILMFDRGCPWRGFWRNDKKAAVVGNIGLSAWPNPTGKFAMIRESRKAA